jgi:hypothetical protein
MAQAGDHRLAGWTGRPIGADELTGRPVDAARQLPALPSFDR